MRVSWRDVESDLHLQMEPVAKSVVSTHRTAVITSLTVYPRAYIALHKLNSVQPMP